MVRPARPTAWSLAAALVAVAALGTAACGDDTDPADTGSLPVSGSPGTDVAPGTSVVTVPEEPVEPLPGGARIPLGAPNPVVITGRSFEPRRIEVEVGATVTWVNDDADRHWILSRRPELIDSGPLDPPNSFATVFDTAGTWNYFCNVHEGMTGTVVVSNPSAPTT